MIRADRSVAFQEPFTTRESLQRNAGTRDEVGRARPSRPGRAGLLVLFRLWPVGTPNNKRSVSGGNYGGIMNKVATLSAVLLTAFGASAWAAGMPAFKPGTPYSSVEKSLLATRWRQVPTTTSGKALWRRGNILLVVEFRSGVSEQGRVIQKISCRHGCTPTRPSQHGPGEPHAEGP